jgi:hypothetical protein
MATRRLHERVVEIRGFKYIRLASDRLVTAWEMHEAAKRAHSDLTRAVSRMLTLASSDYDLEQLDTLVKDWQSYLDHVLGEIEVRRGRRTQEERIARLRDTTGRTPAEAEAFRRKADQLEASMQT